MKFFSHQIFLKLQYINLHLQTVETVYTEEADA